MINIKLYHQMISSDLLHSKAIALECSALLLLSKEDEQTLAELSLAHRRSQAKCRLVLANSGYIKSV